MADEQPAVPDPFLEAVQSWQRTNRITQRALRWWWLWAPIRRLWLGY